MVLMGHVLLKILYSKFAVNTDVEDTGGINHSIVNQSQLH